MHFGSFLVHRRTVGSARFLRQIVGSVFHSSGAMGDQDIAFEDANETEDSNMGECDPGTPLTGQAGSDRNPDLTHVEFAYKLKVQILPNDQENREFDYGVDFRIGDLNVFTSGLLLQNHMKRLRILANRIGAFCVKIQQPVTTSTYTKYGQRYWRQPATKTPKQAKPRQTCQRLFSQHNKGGTCRYCDLLSRRKL